MWGYSHFHWDQVPLERTPSGPRVRGTRRNFFKKVWFISRDENHRNRYYAAILVQQKCTQNQSAACMQDGFVHDCANRSGRDKGVYFARVSSVATNQGKEEENLSRERRSRWISAISRDDLAGHILENDHVFSVKTAKNWNRFNVDWVPTLCLGHSKKEAGPKNLE